MSENVSEQSFELEVAGETIPGVLWSPADASGSRPLVLMGHGGSEDRMAVAARAHDYVTHLGFAVAAIDAPDHGDRAESEAAARFTADISKKLAEGRSIDSELAAETTRRSVQAVPEWQAALDLLQKLDFVGDGPVGFWGVSMGTALGIPIVAAEPRITAAVFGLAGLRPGESALAEAAARVTVPVQFVMRWDDTFVPRESALALFDAFGARQKTLHASPGETPRFELASEESFFERHLEPIDTEEGHR
jgi:dienelactone hydrolase